MNPAINEVSTGSSSESDSEDMLLDGEEPELAGLVLNSDDDSMAIDVSPAALVRNEERRAPTATNGRRTSNQIRPPEDSDDDF